MARRGSSTINHPASRETSFFRHDTDLSWRSVEQWSQRAVDCAQDPTDHALRSLQQFMLSFRELPIVPVQQTGEVLPSWESDLVIRWALAALGNTVNTTRFQQSLDNALEVPGLWPHPLLPCVSIAIQTHHVPTEIAPHSMLVWPLRPIETTSSQIMAEQQWRATVAIPTFSSRDAADLRILCETKPALLESVGSLPPVTDHHFLEALLPLWAAYPHISLPMILAMLNLAKPGSSFNRHEPVLESVDQPQTVSVNITMQLPGSL